MKKTIYLVLTFAAVLTIACSNPKKDTREYPLQGAWEITYSKFVSPDTTVEKTQFDKPTVKLLTKKHFAFGNQSGTNKVWGGGGEYTYDGDIYTEYIKYHGASNYDGQSFKFKSTLKGDLWTISITVKNDTLNIESTETWKRILE